MVSLPVEVLVGVSVGVVLGVVPASLAGLLGFALERADRSAYREFLNALSEHIKEMDGLTVLHCLQPATDPRTRALTDQFADVVLSVEPDEDGVVAGGTLNLTKRRTTGGDF